MTVTTGASIDPKDHVISPSDSRHGAAALLAQALCFHPAVCSQLGQQAETVQKYGSGSSLHANDVQCPLAPHSAVKPALMCRATQNRLIHLLRKAREAASALQAGECISIISAAKNGRH